MQQNKLKPQQVQVLRNWMATTDSSDWNVGEATITAFAPEVLDDASKVIIEELLDYKCRESSNYEHVKLKKIWHVVSRATKTRTCELSVPHVAHFDRKRYLKLFIYLSPVTSADGPLTVSNSDSRNFEIARLLLPNSYKERGLNVVTDASEFVPLTGGVGSVFWLDTNTPHFGGLIKKDGRSRKVLRFDFEKPIWNIIPRLRSKIRVGIA